MPSDDVWSMPQLLLQMKGLMMIHNRGKFHEDSICGSKVINFEILSWRCSSHEIGLFRGFDGPFSPKKGLNLLKFGPEVFHEETKSVYQQWFKIMNLSTKGMNPKFSFWPIFGPNLPPKNKLFDSHLY